MLSFHAGLGVRRSRPDTFGRQLSIVMAAAHGDDVADLHDVLHGVCTTRVGGGRDVRDSVLNGLDYVCVNAAIRPTRAS